MSVANIYLQVPDEMCKICNQSMEKKKVFLLHSTDLDDHFFHLKCLPSWLSKNNSCPTCMFQLPDQEVSEIKQKIKSINYENCIKKISFSLAVCIGVLGYWEQLVLAYSSIRWCSMNRKGPLAFIFFSKIRRLRGKRYLLWFSVV